MLSFNGPAYEPDHDHARLTGQIRRVFALMQDGQWRTLDEIASLISDPPASISAQLRHLRKPRFGSNIIERQSRGERSHGLYEYRLIAARQHIDGCTVAFDDEINALELRIMTGEAETDTLRWEQAARVVALRDGGLTQEAIAAQWINLQNGEPYSQQHVSIVGRVIRHYLGSNGLPRPLFTEAYAAAKRGNRCGRRQSKVLVERIRTLAASAPTVKAIAAEMSMLPTNVCRVMKRNEIVLAIKPNITPPVSHSTDDTVARVRDLAGDRYSVAQIVAAMRISRPRVVRIIAQHGIDVPGERHIRHVKRIDPNRFVEQIVIDAEGLTEHLALVDFARLDRDTLPSLIARARTARTNFTAFIHQLIQTQEGRQHERDADAANDTVDPTHLESSSSASRRNADTTSARRATAV